MATVKIFNHHFRTPFIFLLLLEIIILFASVYAGEYIRFDRLEWQPSGESLTNFPYRAACFAIVMLLGMVAMGQYQSSANTYSINSFPSILIRISISLVLGLLALLVLYYLVPEILLGRGILAYSLIASAVALTVVRVLFHITVDARNLKSRILVLGAGALAKSLMSQNKNKPARALSPMNSSYTIHGFVEFGEENVEIDEKYLVKPGENLVEYCEAYEITEIVLAISDRRKKMPVEALLDCKLSGLNVVDFVTFCERERGYLRLDMLNPSWMIFCDGCTHGSVNHYTIRLFDLLVSGLILLMMLPVLIITAILIFIESGFKGPIFYSQERVGFNGKIFKLLKFRSMIVGAEKNGEAQFAAKNDARVTRIGKFIRKVRIDELPQIINIFNGDMSLVGPRPERPEFVAEFEKKIPFFKTRHRVKPGLAGWAQLKYPYGANEQDTYNKLQYDLYYVKNHSFIMDVFVLLQTVEVILLGKGAR
jgi:sugar transferase (PEP-CTERM system associated)